jgi:hypothetical protein
VARFRLRFLLQELDLVGQDVLLGRSPDCQISLEDPLVSRQHARIRIHGEVAMISDLGSRNGVRVNGSLIPGETPLSHNDRIRLGTQDFVFLVVDEKADRMARSTGYMINCAGCGRPFPGEVSACPHCGQAVDEDEGDTVTNLVYEPQTSWTFQLLGEVIERALLGGRSTEAERMLRRATGEIDERLAGGAQLDAKHLAMVSGFALRLAKLSGEAEWAEWVIGVHRAHGLLPTNEVLDQMQDLDKATFETLRPMIEGFMRWWRTSRSGAAPEEEKQRSSRFAAFTGA